MSSIKNLKYKSLTQAFKGLYENEDFTDVTFIVEGEKLKAHKVILCSRSPFFKTLLNASPTSSVEKTVITLSNLDITAKNFKRMLCFLYTDDCPIHATNVWEMLNIADMYSIPLLTEKCIKYVCETVNKCNVLEYSQKALVYDKKSEMMKKCWEIINGSYDYVITTEAFLKISPDLLAEFAQHCIRDNENLFFDQVIAWARAECERQDVKATAANIQKLLINIKPNLNFCQMDVYNLVTKVRNTGLVTSKELLDAIAAVATEQRKQKLQKQQSDIDSLNKQLSLDMDFLERWSITPNPALP